MIRRTWPLLGALAVLVAAADVQAIVIRHDRPDTGYRKLGQDFPAVGSLLPVGQGAATLIAPNWAITAAHVADGVSPFSLFLRFGDRDYAIDRVFLHPSWHGDPGYEQPDLALLRLAEPVQGIRPAAPYGGSDEVGQQVVLIGWGDTGTGKIGATEGDRVRRGATNVVTGADRRWITFRFDEPPDGTDLEGIAGPGDSGGPALLQRGSAVYVLGVSSANDAMGTGVGPCRYGSTEIYARVSTAIDWIRSVLAGRAGEGIGWGPVHDFRSEPWPETTAARAAREFFAAYATGSDDAFAGFVRAWRTAEALARKPLDLRVEEWQWRRAEWGDLTPVRFVESAPERIHVLVHTSRARWLRMTFRTGGEDPARLESIAIAPDGPAGRPGR